MSLGQLLLNLNRCGSSTSCAVGMRHEVVRSQRLNMAHSRPVEIRRGLLRDAGSAKNNA